MLRHFDFGPKARGCEIVLIAIVAGLVFGGVIFAVPEFRLLFHGFGAPLPWETQIVLAAYRYSLLLPLLIAIPYIIRWHREKAHGAMFDLRGLALRCLVAAFVVVAMAAYAMYASIFRMGAVILVRRQAETR